MSTREDPSIFARQYGIPAIEDSVSQWDKVWEHQILPNLSASEDVFPALSKIWHLDQPGTSTSACIVGQPRRMSLQVCRLQDLVTKLYFEMFQRNLVTILLFMTKEERRRHVLNGLRDACRYASLGQDARALCPEITSSAMLHRNGQILILFIHTLAHETNKIYPDRGRALWLWNDGWANAVVVPKPWPNNIAFAYLQLSIQRNEFIAQFFLQTLISVIRKTNYMSPIANLLRSDDFFTSSAWVATATLYNEIRCTYCTGSTEELGKKLKFMLCGNCKSKLTFAVYYCSRACQKADWPYHKDHCGRTKPSWSVNKDRYWKFIKPSDEELDAMPPAHGDIILDGVFFGGDPNAPLRTPALQRQVALLSADKTADYFLFDDTDRPVRFATSSEDMWVRMTFRVLRDEAMYNVMPQCQVEALAEYLIEVMGDTPGLGRERIIAQFNTEYGVDVAPRMMKLRERKIEYGFSVGKTFLEGMGRRRMPKVMMQPH